MHEEGKVRKGIGKKGKESLKEEYGKERKVWGKSMGRKEVIVWEGKEGLREEFGNDVWRKSMGG